MKKELISLLLLSTGLLLYTCTKDDSVKDSAEDIKHEILTDSQVEFWDNQESLELGSDEIMLPNGLSLEEYLIEMDPDFYNEWDKKSISTTDELGPQDSKNLLIARLTMMSVFFTTRSNFVYEGTDMGDPPQNGLAYALGSRNYTERMKPRYGKCSEEVYGLDCSGLIWNMFLGAGVDIGITTRAEHQRQPDRLQTAIKKAFPELKKIKVEDLGKIETSEVESGDIIYWIDDEGEACHIGMMLKTSTGTLALAQSNGSGYIKCEDNYGPRRGPRFMNLNAAIQPPPLGFDDNYSVVRINAEISGKWDVVIRCQNETYDFLTVSLDFPTTNSTSFNISKEAVYQGDNIHYNLEFLFEYDNVTNILSCNFGTSAAAFPNFYRWDSFSVKLERDNTGYFPVTLGQNENAGCLYDVKLVNKEVTSVKGALLSGMKQFLNSK